MTSQIQGIAASAGIAMGKAYLLKTPDLSVTRNTVKDPQTEKQRLGQAVEQAKVELEEIKEHARVKLGEDKAAIFAAHLLVLSDPELLDPIQEKIENEGVNAEYALHEVSQMFITMFEQMDNDYMRERAADIRDVTNRVLAKLLNVTIPNLSLISEEVIIIAEDLTPSDTAQLNRNFVKGFVTNIGGRTSHSAIMARSMEIPAVVGTKTATSLIEQGKQVIVDGINGLVIVNPTEELHGKYQETQLSYEAQKAEWAKLVHESTVTIDNHQVELAANIGTPDDVLGVLENGGEGIGLYRTEFLYMGRSQLPTEEEQFESYKTVLEKMEGKPVVVRTLDIGGDKELPYLNLPKEMNPFLGFRAIRLCLEEKELFRVQLRALLRASVYGNLKIMFPMVATIEEFLAAKEMLLAEKDSLRQNGIQVADDIEIGIMVEIPSVALIADQFAELVDFFSIGTNDLIQYTMAADRMNERVSYLYQPYHPAILRLIDHVIQAAHRNGKWVGMCGEMAGDPIAIPILLGLGLDEFSMSATSILPARNQLRKLSKQEVESLREKILSMRTSDDVASFIKTTFLK
ncbi:phosphoenolpyruvate--protein phosphotransferase [Ammoniphilus sp. CFH 90114]|uniref:phosphoenolpyruvate--protein phosphotransferase n=1 Tax=Ammoniphilus sp. CFH 90114 TaxID=2493665 RepID=UPI00100E311B|nr:phosphoenolpyruvate--protein phosphotransferase [Ammoniphilus sp. CFH 90114]RXT15369.1 phosphoenolpyruvate--protein phosphotransferase [Ammoniphilus sp. CFH 90114]